MTLSTFLLVSAVFLSPARIDPPAGPLQVDLDNDGVADVLSADPATNTVTISGAGGAVLRTFVPPVGQPAQQFGTATRLVPDISGDGVADLAVLAPGASPQGAVDLFNPVTGARLWRSVAPVASATTDGWWFLNDLIPIDDQNEDGHPDIVVDASPDGDGFKWAALLDGATGRLLAVRSGHPSDMIEVVGGGVRVYRPTDVNDDGLVAPGDFAAFLDLLMNADTRADMNNDGVVNGLDLDLMMRDLLDGATTMMLEGSSGGSGGGGGGNGGGSGTGGGGGTGTNQAVPITPGTCTQIWRSGTVYDTCNEVCIPQTVPAACNESGLGTEPFRYLSPFCEQTNNLITHRVGELTVQGIFATLMQMYYTQSGEVQAGSAMLVPYNCQPNDGIEAADVLAFGWSTDQPLLVNAQAGNNGASLFLTLRGEAQTYAQVNIYFHIWIRSSDNAVHHCCYRIPFTVLPDCASVTMKKLDDTATATPVVCEGVLLADQPMVLGGNFYPRGGVARWTVRYTMRTGGVVTATNIGPTALINPSVEVGTVDVDVDYQFGSVYSCGPAWDSAHFVVDLDGDHDGLADSCDIPSPERPCLSPTNPDSDGDGFLDGVEVALGSDPCDIDSVPDLSIDTDGDGLTDYEEVAIHHTDPRRADTDNDGADDFGEVELKRLGHPLSPLDAFSFTHNLGQPLVRDGYTTLWSEFDRDGDHMFDLLEEVRGLRTDRADSDGDGVPDGVELRHGLDANSFDAGFGDGFGRDDSDGDGLSDELEMRLGLDPHSMDSDGDGLMDGFELTAGLDPLNGDSLGMGAGWGGADADAALDADGDGLSNLQEQMYGTDPRNADSRGDGSGDAVWTSGGTPQGWRTLALDLSQNIGEGLSLCAYESYSVRVGNAIFTATGSPVLFESRHFEMPVRPGSVLPVRILHQGVRFRNHMCAETVSFGTPAQTMLWARTERFPIISASIDGVAVGTGGNGFLVPATSSDTRFAPYLWGGGVDWTSRGVWGCIDAPEHHQEFVYCMQSVTEYDNTRALFVCPILRCYDLQGWGPHTAADGTLAFADYNLFAAKPQFEIRGAVTDGVSVCVIRAELEDGPLPVEWVLRGFEGATIEIRKRSAGHPGVAPDADEMFFGGPTMLDLYGGFVPVDPYLWSMPQLLVPTGTPLGSRVSFDSGVALYVPPEAYIDAQHNSERIVVDHPEMTLEDGEATRMSFVLGDSSDFGVSYRKLFLLRRPPIVQIHGIYSEPTTWRDPPWRTSEGQPVPTQYLAADWSIDSLKGYVENVAVVPAAIQAALAPYRNGSVPRPRDCVLPENEFTNARYAATRVDVIAHSQGGQLVRLYTLPIEYPSPLPGSLGTPLVRGAGWGRVYLDRGNAAGEVPWFERGDNFLYGDIRRFIPIGSPFMGSPWATLACNIASPAALAARRATALGRLAAAGSAPPGVITGGSAMKQAVVIASTNLLTSFSGDTCAADLSPGSAIELRMLAGFGGKGKGLAWLPIVGQAVDPVTMPPYPAHADKAMALMTDVQNALGGATSPLLPPELTVSPALWLADSDSIVPVDSQVNLLPGPIVTDYFTDYGWVNNAIRGAKAVRVKSHYHSGNPLADTYMKRVLVWYIGDKLHVDINNPQIPTPHTETGSSDIADHVGAKLSRHRSDFILGSY